jgi:putative transposase
MPLGRGFLYLVAIMLAWQLSWTCRFASRRLRRRWRAFGRPEIFNTDQGSRFTSTAFTGVLMARLACAS